MEASGDDGPREAVLGTSGGCGPICKVYIVDDDAGARRAIAGLLSSYSYEIEQFEDGRAFLSAIPRINQGVVLLDLRMRDKDGLKTLSALTPHAARLVPIMISASGEVSSAVAAMRLGASDFLEKPLKSGELLRALGEAQTLLMERLGAVAKQAAAKERISALSRTELKVLRYIISGMNVGEAAQYFQVSKRTLEMHRSAIYAKLGTNHLVEVIQIALDAKIPRLSDMAEQKRINLRKP